MRKKGREEKSTRGGGGTAYQEGKRGREKSWTERRGAEPEPPVAREVDQSAPALRLHLREPERGGGEGERQSAQVKGGALESRSRGPLTPHPHPG